MSYTIQQRFISKNRSRKPLTAKGTILHETATPGASAEAEFNYFNNAYRGASAHAFIDYDSILQTIPWNEKAWHAGVIANNNYIGIELCHYVDAAKFNEIWKRAVWLFAYIHVNVIKVTTINKDTLMSHAEATKKWRQSTHMDPISYFNKFGKTVDDFRSDVQAMINSMIGQQAPGGQPQNNNASDQAQSNLNVLQLQQLLNRLKVRDLNGQALVEDGIKGPKTTSAVKKFQDICGLAADGDAGSQTLSTINEILAKPLIKVGSRGIAVRYVQFRVGTTQDGIFGMMTRNAVISFQRGNGLARDGIVGPNTWKALI